MVYTCEPHVAPPSLEAMLGCVPTIDGATTGPLTTSQLDESFFYQRKRWADAKVASLDGTR